MDTSDSDPAVIAFNRARHAANQQMVPKEIADTAGAVALGTVIAQEVLSNSQTK